jgi:hypothetical protein
VERKLLMVTYCLISFFSYAEAKINSKPEKNIQISKIEIYQGDNHLNKKDFVKKIDSSCTIAHPYGATHEEIEYERKRCVLSKMTFDYDEIINQITLNEKVYLPPINSINIYLEKVKEIDPSSLDSVTIAKVKLFTEINDQISDSLTIYYIKNDYDAFYVESQYYYIDNFIYILKYGSDEDGSLVKFWKKYSISSNGKFKLEDFLECHFDNNLDRNICK